MIPQAGATCYPALSRSRREQGTAHALHTYDGTTIVDVACPVNPVELAVEYKAKA